jgi:hypothetical protein
VSLGNIILVSNKATLIDWELSRSIGSAGPFQGTENYVSIALSCDNKIHTYKRRDDFEALFFVMIHWVYTAGTKIKDLPFSSKEKKKFIQIEWTSFLSNFEQNVQKILNDIKELIYKDYPFNSPENAQDLNCIFTEDIKSKISELSK